LPYDAAIAREYGRVCALLEEKGQPLADADVQIASAALHHELELVTGNLRHFTRVPGLAINRILVDARRRAELDNDTLYLAASPPQPDRQSALPTV